MAEVLFGLIVSLLLSLAGVFSFVIHTYFLRKGREEFNLPISLLVLVAILAVSLAQLVLTVYAFVWI